jgi:antitoxin component of RelBE/YafQ-DinJ toxin-antitoxin module
MATKAQVMVRIDADMKREAEDQAKREGRSLSNLIALAVRTYLDAHKPARVAELEADKVEEGGPVLAAEIANRKN